MALLCSKNATAGTAAPMAAERDRGCACAAAHCARAAEAPDIRVRPSGRVPLPHGPVPSCQGGADLKCIPTPSLHARAVFPAVMPVLDSLASSLQSQHLHGVSCAAARARLMSAGCTTSFMAKWQGIGMVR